MYPTTYLQPGSSNRGAVKKLQDYLVSSGHMTRAQVNTGYGIYGPRTRNAVASLQRSLGVNTSGGGVGYFGPRTLSALRTSLTPKKQTYVAPKQPTTGQFTFNKGPIGIPTTLNTVNQNGIQSTTSVVSINSLGSRFNKLYTGVTPQQAKELALITNPRDWNGDVSRFGGINNPFSKSTLRNAHIAYASKNQVQQPSPQLIAFNKAIVDNNTQALQQMGAVRSDTIPAKSSKKVAPIPVQTPQPIDTALISPTPTQASTQPQQQIDTAPISLTQESTPTQATAPVQTLTPEQQKAQSITNEMQTLNTSLTGKNAYQAQQNTLAGVDKVQQAINDNNLAIERLNTSADQAKLTAENRLAPMFQIQGEQAQINRQRSFQMLGLSAISDALRNNLVSAQQKANEAVQLKYGTIENQIKADSANLSLVLHSPQATLDQRKQAQVMLDANQQKASEVIANRTTQTNIFKLMTLAAQNKDNFKPTTNYPTLSTAMQAITNAKTQQQALVIAANTGLLEKQKSTGGFSLSSGQTRYDAQGNVIAYGRKSVATKTKTARNNISELGSALEMGVKDKGYNGRGSDGYVDPNLYVALFDKTLAMYGDAGAAEFMKLYPPAKDINPANIGNGRLPAPIENAVVAGRSQSSTIQ